MDDGTGISGGQTARPRMVVWADPAQAWLIKAAAGEAGVNVIAAGSAQRAQTGALATALEVPAVDDFRVACQHSEANVLLLASLATDQLSGEDVRHLAAARARGVRIVALTPLPGSAMDLAGAWRELPPGMMVRDIAACVPMPRLSPELVRAGETIDAFGPVEAVSVECAGPPELGSLGARLLGAMDLAMSFLGEPASVDARLTSFGGPRQASERLGAADGHLTAHVRFADLGGATIAASNRAGGWDWSVTLLGPSGRVRIATAGMRWVGPDRRVIDDSRFVQDASPDARTAAALARGITDLLNPANPPVIGDVAGVLAACGAALLSSRTGQAESPATIKRMVESSQA